MSYEVVNEPRLLRQVEVLMIPAINCEITIHEETQEGVVLVNHSFSSRRTRHIDVKHFVVRVAVDEGVAKIKYVLFEG